MAGLIPQPFVNTLLERVDILDVLGPRVELKKASGNHRGRCPFHDENTPSFYVYPDGHYHCFGCGAHGTALRFLMEREGMTFPEAVESLASMVGLEVPRERGSAPTVDTGLYDVLKAASKQFKTWLRQHQVAIDYLKGRGLTGESARDFDIGYAPDGWSNLKDALRAVGEPRLTAAGLLASSEGGRTYDRFRSRIMFPIRDTRGRVIGFGGRVLEGATDGQPKYLNSPETELFRKGREVYGLFEARRDGRIDEVVVVEGYMDVVALAQHGIRNAVATLGTAIGEAHFEKLYKVVGRVICCFDGDDAGREAAWKAVNAAFPTLSAGRRLDFVFLPDGDDPDSLIRRRGAARFNGLLANAVPVGRYFLDRLQAGFDLDSVDDRATLTDLALPRIAQLPAGELRASIVRELARLTRQDGASLAAQLSPGDAPNRPRQPDTPNAIRPTSKLANTLLRTLVRQPEALALLADDDRARLAALAEPPLDDVLGYLVDEAPGADAAMLLGRFVGHPVHGQLVALSSAESLLQTDARDLQALVRRYCDSRQTRSLRERARVSPTEETMREHLAAKREALAGVDESDVASI